MLADGDGLFMVIYQHDVLAGAFSGRRHSNSKKLGAYPDLTLSQARRACLNLREMSETQADTGAMERLRRLDEVYDDWCALVALESRAHARRWNNLIA